MLPIGFDSPNRDDKSWSLDIPTSSGSTRANAEEDERKKLALDFNATGNGNPAGYVNASAWLQCPNYQ